MKELWVKMNGIINKNMKDELFRVATTLCDVIYVDEQPPADVKETEVKTAGKSEKCDIYVLEGFNPQKIEGLKRASKKVAVRITIERKEDEEKAIRAARLSPDYLIIHCPDWKVIPLENLIASTRGKTKLLAEVLSAEDAKLALETLELGADGIVLVASDENELIKAAFFTKKRTPKIKLVPVKVVSVKSIGTGARVCVDTCDLMKGGEGLLLGCQSACLFLVEAEVHENPFVSPRPFRVNAGPVSLYTLCSPDKTRYLSELKTGGEILIVDRNGNTRITNIGRVKIEWRPMLLIEAEYEGRKFKTIVQNAETIRFVSEKDSISVTELKVGDTILAHISEGGRHFGTLVEEEAVMEL